MINNRTKQVRKRISYDDRHYNLIVSKNALGFYFIVIAKIDFNYYFSIKELMQDMNIAFEKHGIIDCKSLFDKYSKKLKTRQVKQEMSAHADNVEQAAINITTD